MNVWQNERLVLSLTFCICQGICNVLSQESWHLEGNRAHKLYQEPDFTCNNYLVPSPHIHIFLEVGGEKLHQVWVHPITLQCNILIEKIRVYLGVKTVKFFFVL